jgi:prophage antirepressor-like protein
MMQQFQFNTFTLEVIEKDGEPWFIASPLAEFLGYKNPSEAIRTQVDDADIAKIYIPIKSNNYVCVNESGRYSLVIRSNKPEAKLFKRWVTSEVLPSIRKHGYYAKPQDLPFDHIPPVEQPFQKVHPLLFSELRRMNKGMAQAYLVECGVTPGYVSEQLKKIDGAPVYHPDRPEATQSGGALTEPTLEDPIINIKADVIRIVRNKGKEGISASLLPSYCKPFGKLSVAERHLMVDQLLAGGLLVLVKQRTQKGQTTCRLVHPDFIKDAA